MEEELIYENKIYRYNHFGRHLAARYGSKIHKVNINAGFTCPHRDEKTNTGGCIFCDNRAFNKYAYPEITRSVRQQLAEGIARKKNIYGIEKIIAYFQAYSNTNDSLERLRGRYDIIRDFPEIVGLSIGTRPDCIDPQKLDLIETYTKNYQVWIEYGLQSASDAVLAKINRGHTLRQFLDAIEMTAGRPVSICVHLILGLPGETRDSMMQTADLLATLPIQGIKLHNICVVKGTELERLYRRGEFAPLSFDEYVQAAVDFLERIPYEITVQRLTADSPADIFVAPDWARDRWKIMNAINDEFIRRDSFQGIRV
ncbi:MAG: TIGR01212 family radical SAM protein [Thermodesulfobacteriota bacterium]